MESGDTERRRVRRRVLEEPLNGVIGHVPVLLLDISPAAVRISHHDDVGSPGATCPLRFHWRGRSVVLWCMILRSDLQPVGSGAFARSVHHSALRILAGFGDAEEVLQSMVSAPA